MRIFSIIKRLVKKVIRIFKMLLSPSKISTTYEEAESFLEVVSSDVKTNSFVEDIAEYMNNKYDLSIIVPAFNVEQYVEECILSILSQETKYRYEIIIVNDGSTDSTKDLLNRFINMHDIKIIDQENRGLSGARNTGIDCAQGKYLMFVDSDDKLLPYAIENIMTCALMYDADCVEGGYISLLKNGQEIINKVKTIGNVVARGNFKGFMWGKVYKRKCFEGIRFPEKYWFEDSINAQVLFDICKKCYAIGDIIYVYRQNDSSITAKARTNVKAIDSLWITRQLMKERRIKGLPFDQSHYEYFLHMVSLTYARTINLDENIKRNIFVIWCELYREYYSGYKITSDSYKKKLETALAERKYKLYLFSNELNTL